MANELIFYKTPASEKRIEVVYREENFWMPQRAIADLFSVGIPAINKHLKNIYDSGELSPEATISKMEIVRQEGVRQVRRTVEFYNLDAIIAVGYRVNSYEATQFRIWATKTLKEFIIKGFVLKDKGKVSALEAKLKAKTEFEVFRQRQDKDFVSDFDREIKRIQGKSKEEVS